MKLEWYKKNINEVKLLEEDVKIEQKGVIDCKSFRARLFGRVVKA